MSKFISHSLLTCLLFLLVSVWITENVGNWKNDRVLVYDSAGYYLYLPAVFIHNDLYELDFYKLANREYPISHQPEPYGIHPHPETGKMINKYPLGLSFFQLPFFATAHWYVVSGGDRHQADGFSKHYQRAISYSTIFFSFLGLLMLRLFLKKYFEEKYVWPTLAIIAFGTNFYYYSAFFHGLTHTYSFFLYSSVLLLSYKWHLKPNLKTSLLLGLCIGLATICRPTDILVALIPLAWKITDVNYTLQIFRKHSGKLLIAALGFFIPVSVQLLYWYGGTGSFMYYSYSEEGFDFTNPQILNGLFSFRKGWFIYTPLALLGFIGLYYALRQKQFKDLSITTVIFYLFTIYIVFSWWMWYYGGSFGCRVLIQTYPLLAVPIALLLKRVYQSRKKWLIASFSAILVFGIALNIFQSYQYNRGIIHWDSMTWEWYWQVFLSTQHWSG